MNNRIATCIFFLVLISLGLNAQNGKGDKDPFEGLFYGPEFIMKYQKEIDLTKQQRKSIIAEVKTAQRETGDMQWDLVDKMEDLKTLIDQSKIDEKKIISLMEELLLIENKIKKAQLLLMVRIKNTLSSEQQKLLDRLKK